MCGRWPGKIGALAQVTETQSSTPAYISTVSDPKILLTASHLHLYCNLIFAVIKKIYKCNRITGVFLIKLLNMLICQHTTSVL